MNRFFDKEAEKKNTITSVTHDAQRFVHIRADRKIHKVSEAEIRYIESLDDYVKVHLKEMILITRENISTLEEKLPNPPFVRIHRSFIININWVKTISNEGVELNGKELPFGRAFKKSALNQLSVKQLK